MSRWPLSMPRGDRWIPWSFVAFFAVVLAANGSMMFAAFSSWPGLETTSAYQRGLAYNRMLAAADKQAELDWQVAFVFTQDGRRRGIVEVDLADRFGSRLRDAEVRAQFVRPTSEGSDLSVELPHQTGGHYRADVELPLEGQWDVRIVASSGGKVYRLSRRILLRP